MNRFWGSEVLGFWGSAGILAMALQVAPPAAPVRFPAHRAMRVNPDTHLVLTFSRPPSLGRTGQIRIYDAADHRLVDTLDMSRPVGPGGETVAIGGFTEGFHVYPVILHGRVATIYPHPHVLHYGRAYSVEIDAGAIVADGFAGLRDWTFTVKPEPPSASGDRLVVSSDGRGDFSTVQGAVDFIPGERPRRMTVFIRAGTYEEIVYFRQKHDITFLGEDRDAVVIGYANNETFNGPPAGVPTNEKPGTFPYRRAAFMADGSTGIHIRNLTLRNYTPRGGGQAEALLLMGGQNIVSHVSLYSFQDTVQFNDSVYIADSSIEGDTDFLWGRGPAFFERCEITELGNNPFMWVRSTAASHGFVFVDSRFHTPGASGAGPLLARNTAGYPNSEVVLIRAAIGRINPAAWSLAGDTTNQHYWEYGSTNLPDGTPADGSGRHPASRHLRLPEDAALVANYSNPAFVLGGWTPSLK